jgi:hypothetical protein
MARDWVKRSVLTATAFGAGAFTLCTPAFGFFPPVVNPDGKVTVTKPPIIPPLPPIIIPPVPLPVPPPTVPPVIPPTTPPPTPQSVPEPATLVAAGMGLAAVAAARLRKRRR